MKYAELLRRTDAPAGSSWQLWPNNLGTLNYLTDDVVKAAAACVRTGERISLVRPFPTVTPDQSVAAPPAGRGPAVHHVYPMMGPFMDDYLDGYFPQASSQIDALRHARHPDHGFYNGVSEHDIVSGNAKLGISEYADHGIVGRGVLLDVGAYMERHPEWGYNPTALTPISVAMLEAVQAEENVTLSRGDILVLRTAGSPSGRGPGLGHTHDMLEWIWDNEFAMVAADNLAVELFPVEVGSPFQIADSHPAIQGMLHPWLLAMLGIALGEQWALDALGAACAADGVFDFMLTAVPLSVVGGVGSPANAIAIR